VSTARVLSVVICTRDRPSELERCIESLAHGRPGSRQAWEVIIVDDGRSRPVAQEPLRGALGAAGVALHVVRPSAPGLFAARLTGLERASGTIVLFLDDDVTVASDYLARLLALYEQHPEVVGVGGVDQLDPARSMVITLAHRLFLFDSGSPGRLSYTGFNGSLRRWVGERSPFESEYLHGCNMSFRTSALADIGRPEWLLRSSQADDIFFSYVAAKHGHLLVSPALRVWHHRSPQSASRPDTTDAARADIVNIFQLLRLRRASLLQVAAFFWTAGWFVLKDVARPSRSHLVSGYVKGVFAALRAIP